MIKVEIEITMTTNINHKRDEEASLLKTNNKRNGRVHLDNYIGQVAIWAQTFSIYSCIPLYTSFLALCCHID